MKKFLSMTMTLIMLMALAFPAFAVDKESDSNSEAEVQEEILESASEFAYLDADKATPELKEKILEMIRIVCPQRKKFWKHERKSFTILTGLLMAMLDVSGTLKLES